MLKTDEIHKGKNAKLFIKDGSVVKKFGVEGVYEAEKKFFVLLNQFTPEATFDDGAMTITMELCVPLLDWIKDKNKEEKRVMAKKILNLIKHTHYRNISHNDLHANNIVVRVSDSKEFTPLLIDLENATLIKNELEWWETNDLTGEKYMGFNCDHALSIKLTLGFNAYELLDEVREKDLLDDLLTISADAYGPEHGEGLYYSSYHHPRFYHVNSQRNTEERWDLLKHPILNESTILDLGCNTGAISVMAAMHGATKVIGVDSDERWVQWCVKLFNYLNYNGSFIHSDINELTILPECDVIFAMAISAWVDYDHLIKLIEESNARVVYFEDNRPEKEPKFALKGFHCEEVGFHQGRLNFVCRRLSQ
jgi:hypothetical protein